MIESYNIYIGKKITRNFSLSYRYEYDITLNHYVLVTNISLIEITINTHVVNSDSYNMYGQWISI